MTPGSNIQHLHLLGISHHNTPVEVREQLSLSKEQMVQLYATAKEQGINSIFAISTCNRTELYALTDHAEKMVALLVNITLTGTEQLKQYAYCKTANDAVQHLLKVATGLDAQIIGDAQITGQIRELHQLALQHNALDATLNRLIESAIAAGKEVKAATQSGAGAFSVAHTAVKRVLNAKGKRYLIVGLGKTGKLVLKSLLKFVAPESITVMNRTDATAFETAKEFSVYAAEYAALQQQVALADVVFAATSSPLPIISTELLQGISLEHKTFVDLSLPRNIEPGLNARVIDLDGLTDSNNYQKQEYITLAERVITETITEYGAWLHRYELAQLVKSQIAESIFDNELDEGEGSAPSKFVDGITHKHLRYFQKGKQSRNLAA